MSEVIIRSQSYDDFRDHVTIEFMKSLLASGFFDTMDTEKRAKQAAEIAIINMRVLIEVIQNERGR